MQDLIIFTDLDGTLLDHHSYSFEAARPAIERINSLNIPWILNSSKTLAELLALRTALHQRHPLILENGAGVAIPEDYQHPLWTGLDRKLTSQNGFMLHCFGFSREAILHLLQPAKLRYQFTGFSDFSVADLCKVTGLTEAAAALALQRHFSEPILWEDSAEKLEQFKAYIAQAGLILLQGGRFLHVMGSADKGRAMQWLLQGYTRADQPPHSIALGDSHNDIAMLNKADIAVVIRSPVHEPISLPEHPHVVVSDGEGPVGWNQTLQALIPACP